MPLQLMQCRSQYCLFLAKFVPFQLQELSAGDMVNVLIEGYEEYDLIGKEV